MGIKGLWQHLPETDKEQTLMELTVKRGFEANPQGLRAYRIGIDVSLWFFHARKVTGQTRNGELQMFFHRCCRLLGAPVLPLFVFDGPNRPTIKRNKELKIIENSQLNDIREMIIAFGFECVTAPGEAEAALAQLNAEGIIDAVLSDDVDCFLFGAKTVLRSVKRTPKSTYMEYLNIYDIQTLESSLFSRDELVFVALLRGSDYDGGLTGCGITTAANLRQFRFRKCLIEHWNGRVDSLPAWVDFLTLWRNEVKEKLLPTCSLGPVNRTVANNIISDEFPKNEVLSAYLNPVIFDAQDLEYISGNLWKSELNISRLARACLNKFQWSTESKIFEAFKSLVWPGAVMRLLLEAVRKTDKQISIEVPFEPVSVKRKPKVHANCVSIQLSTAIFEKALTDGIFNHDRLYEDTISLPSRIARQNPTVAMTVNDSQHKCFWIHHSIIAALQHLATESSAQEYNVHDPEIPSESDNWLVKAAEDIIYVSSDSDDSNCVICISSGSD